MRINGLYEASGLALWLRTGVFSMNVARDFSPGDVSYTSLLKFENDFFSKDVCMKGYVQRGQKKSKTAKLRLVWPITMVVGCDTAAEIEKKTHFDSSLNTAGCHFALWSWYLALFHALLKNVAWMQTSTAVFIKKSYYSFHKARAREHQVLACLTYFQPVMFSTH